jgi:hypothetical protein
VALHIDGEELSQVVITEWVVEAGDRLWIVRASRGLEDDIALRPESALSTSLFSGTELGSTDVRQPSTSLTAMQQNLPPAALDPGMHLGLSSAAPNLPFPSWWSGECDINNYSAATGVPAYPLGAEYRGMRHAAPGHGLTPAPRCGSTLGTASASLNGSARS